MSEETRSTLWSTVLQLLIIIVFVPLLPLLITQRWDWWQAWAYAGISIFGFIVSRALAARASPDLLAERARMTRHTDTASWDKTLSPLLALGSALIPLVAGLDERFAWSQDVTLELEMLGLFLFAMAYVLGGYALIANRFFSGVARIQSERGHHVVSEGPYQWVRHPGYAGMALSLLGSPLLLDALWAYLPVLLLIVALVLRTYLEDRMLLQQLEGYREYASRVRFRLLPGIW